MKHNSLAFIAFLFIAGCAPKVLILQSPVVSMKVSDAGNAKDLKDGNKVNETWCADQNPIVPNDDGSKHYGLIDQVIWKAHKKSKADLFKDAKFYQQGNCVSMQAIAAVGGNSPVASPTQDKTVKKPGKRK